MAQGGRVDAGIAAAHAAKREMLLALLRTRSASALTLTSQPALAWYLEGARVGVSRAGDPVLSVRVAEEGDRLYVHANEAERIAAEELRIDIEVEPVPWFEPLPVEGLTETAVAAELRAARRRLAPHEVRAYRSLGRDAAAAVTAACRDAAGSHTERALAGAVAGRLEAIGAESLVVLVGGASRADRRHPLPTDAELGRRALVVVCARRDGLIANLSRWVGEELSPSRGAAAARDREERIARVEADAFAATRPGASLGGILDAIAASYARHGFGPEEWMRHHQGGPTGYAGRDPRATPGSTETVVEGQAFAWNPTACAAKIEDTVLLGEAGIEVLTVDEAWPAMTVQGRSRPTMLCW
jgi:Xaa-Pro aminopeptidase